MFCFSHYFLFVRVFFPMFFVFPFLFFVFYVFPFFLGGARPPPNSMESNLCRHPSKSMQTIFSGPVSDFCVGRHLGMQWNL